MKNMLIHEMALLCAFFGIRSSQIAEVTVDTDYTFRQTLRGPQSGREFTDFSKLAFSIVSEAGAHVSLKADRCGGNMSWSEISEGGEAVAKFVRPDKEEEVAIRDLEEKEPGCFPYFYLQDPDYILLKSRF